MNSADCLSNPAAADGAASDCAATTCRWRCALDVIDELLGKDRGSISGEETDLLLDLRWQLRRREEAETALRLFCDLRLRMEGRHYLAFFRIRRWMENHLLALVRVCPAAEDRPIAVKLDFYCVEAIRRMCLCASLGRGSVMIAPRLRFAFREVAPVVAQSAGTEKRAATLAA